MAAGLTLAITALSAAYNYSEGRKQKAAQEDSQNASAAQQQIEGINQKRRLARQARVRRAQILQSSSNTGTSGSSGEGAAVGNLAANVAAGTAGLAQSQMFSQTISSNNQKIADSQFRVGVANSVAQFSTQALGAYGNYRDAQKIEDSIT